MGRSMLEAMFIVHLDDYHGFIVEKKYPDTLTLNEKLLNMVYFEHSNEKKTNLKLSEREGRRIVSYMHETFPGWMVCFVIGEVDNLNLLEEEITGMSRLVLELVTTTPDEIDLEEIIRKRSKLPTSTEEQRLAKVFLTPSTALILERMETQGVESAARLSIWLKNEVQSDTVDIREAVAPMINSGIVKVEIIGKTKETVFLMKDIFGYRAPPVESMIKTETTHPEIMEKYRKSVETFFSPPPPDKGYNPTLPVDDPNSPIMEDREQIARIISHNLHYIVLKCLRSGPCSIEDIMNQTSFPKNVVQNSLWALESDRIAVSFDNERVWGLITNPVIESFIPEYVLPLVSRKLVDKEVNRETVIRYLELLENAWGES
ncbi:MAG: hypothetical protein P1Q69_15855 [Candidatus Thorarchaeota archaeon]|nr:hypothetical protein [Candidatus Thorarchaeota archaeon]